MPIRSISQDPVTKTLTIGYGGQLHTIRKASNDITINDQASERLTGNPTSKRTSLQKLIQRQVFDTTVLITTLPEVDEARIADPNRDVFFWSDADGTKNTSGLFITAREVVVDSVDATQFDSDEVSLTIRRLKVR